ncbi:MAG: hypothetical protein WD471_01710 [Candidatus Paceibacterota bacterium]
MNVKKKSWMSIKTENGNLLIKAPDGRIFYTKPDGEYIRGVQDLEKEWNWAIQEWNAPEKELDENLVNIVEKQLQYFA